MQAFYVARGDGVGDVFFEVTGNGFGSFHGWCGAPLFVYSAIGIDDLIDFVVIIREIAWEDGVGVIH